MLPWGLGNPIDWEPLWTDRRLETGHWRISLSDHFVRLVAAPELRGGIPPTGPDTQLLRIWYYTEYPYLWRVPALDLVPLVEFLVATPTAIQELCDPDKTTRLLSSLSAHRLSHDPIRTPLAGAGLDRHLAITAALNQLGCRTIRGRPIRGEALPPIDELKGIAKSRLAANSPAHGDKALERDISQFLTVEPWPFDALTSD
ncbi:MAG: hypothetical protein GY708_28975 [Actinomycetia bacterium]|nr:hypothetical protein [Actinomycetes bacterium]